MKPIVPQPAKVPQPQHAFWRAFCLDNERLVFAPICARCGEPILDTTRANIVVVSESGFAGPDPSQRTVVEGHQLEPIAGRVVAIHQKCGTGRRNKPWNYLSSVVDPIRPRRRLTRKEGTAKQKRQFAGLRTR